MSESLLLSANTGAQEQAVVIQNSVQPDLVSVGVVLFEWNEAVRLRVQRLGAQLGQTGIKIQLLTHSDIVRQDEKIKRLQGVIFQLPLGADDAMTKRFEMVFRKSRQYILADCDAAAAFTVPGDNQLSNVELAMQVSFASHASDCQWLGLEYSQVESASFQAWCEGIANSVRQLARKQSSLAA